MSKFLLFLLDRRPIVDVYNFTTQQNKIILFKHQTRFSTLNKFHVRRVRTTAAQEKLLFIIFRPALTFAFADTSVGLIGWWKSMATYRFFIMNCMKMARSGNSVLRSPFFANAKEPISADRCSQSERNFYLFRCSRATHALPDCLLNLLDEICSKLFP